jgi:hypothetical protein
VAALGAAAGAHEGRPYDCRRRLLITGKITSDRGYVRPNKTTAQVSPAEAHVRIFNFTNALICMARSSVAV